MKIMSHWKKKSVMLLPLLGKTNLYSCALLKAESINRQY